MSINNLFAVVVMWHSLVLSASLLIVERFGCGLTNDTICVEFHRLNNMVAVLIDSS